MKNFEDIVKLLIILGAIFASIITFIGKEAQAGVYLDLDIGVNLDCEQVQSIQVTNYSCGDYGQIGNENPIGSVTAGYMSPALYEWKRADIKWNIYYRHMSSINTDHERGVNVIMTGIRIGSK